MGKSTTAKRKVYYRKTEFNGTQKRTLQQLLSDALSKHQLVHDRSEAIGAQANELRLISKYLDLNGFLCGHLVVFERGSFQTVINDDPQAKALALSAITPPKLNNVPHQFVPGVLYFAIRNNHVVVIQSPNLRTTAFENHLAWLLRTKSGLLTNQQGFVLKDEPQPATKEKIRKSHVKSVSIGRPLMSESSADVGIVNLQPSNVKKFKPDNMFVNLVREMLDDTTRFERLGLEDTLFDGNLEIWIEIRYPKRQRSKTEGAVKLLDNLGIALRDIDDTQACLKLNDGSVVKGKELRISSDIDVNVDGMGIPNDNDIFDQMGAWLQLQIKNGVIAPD